MKISMAGIMEQEGKEIHFLTLERDGFIYEFWPSPFNNDDIRYSVTRKGETEAINSGSLLR